MSLPIANHLWVPRAGLAASPESSIREAVAAEVNTRWRVCSRENQSTPLARNTLAGSSCPRKLVESGVGSREQSAARRH